MDRITTRLPQLTISDVVISDLGKYSSIISTSYLYWIRKYFIDVLMTPELSSRFFVPAVSRYDEGYDMRINQLNPPLSKISAFSPIRRTEW
jgi:hypothetical protein